jgi:hypothetical protein
MPLLDLPNEILGRIIVSADSPSPFDASLHLKPKSSLVPRESHDGIRLMSMPAARERHAPLKSLVSTCRLLHALALPLLFKHALLNTGRLSDFLAFLHHHKLPQHVSSVVAYLPGHYSHIHPAWWARLLNEVPAKRLTIVAAPEVLAELTGVINWANDAWAFDMPLQFLRFDQSAEAARSRIDYDNLPEFLMARPWEGMAYNEGSSIAAYTTYEYFLRKTPSLMTALHSESPSPAADHMFSNLLSFEFIAICPFYNHVEEILKSIRKMIRLQILKIKLCPEPGTTTFQDEYDAVNGALDINDPWNECQTSWTLVAHTVAFLTVAGDLREVRMDDVKVQDMRQGVERFFNMQLPEAWQYQGEGSGIWRRDPSARKPVVDLDAAEGLGLEDEQ